MDNVNPIVGTSLSAIFQLRRLEGGRSAPPEKLHRQMRGYVDELKKRAQQAGFNEADTQDMAYAVVALADEVALGLGESVHDYWMAHPLQFHFFKENQAGEGFFERLREVRQDPNRLPVLQVYHLALAFGFQGRYAMRGGELELIALREDLTRDLSRALPKGFDADVLSDQAERPDERSSAPVQSMTLVVLAGAGLILALLIFIGLKVALISAVSDVEKVAASANAKHPPKVAARAGDGE